MIEVKKVKLRFDKWKHTTEKAYLLVYNGQEVWLSKKICWNLQVAGNDLHAWAEVPAFKFKELTGYDPSEAFEKYGIEGMRTRFGALIDVVVEKHVPTKVKPVENNYIEDLKK